ncbi:versatile peroxidase VPL1 [Thozetella sp. PMI_491]|nr:versatile peroxidase VPL1 [Thozetella sp. PMI_491]
MHLTRFIVVGLAASTHAASLPQPAAGNIEARASTPVPTVCPPVWKNVKAELNTLFMSGNQCNDLARAAIRAAFHDCGTWDSSQGSQGGCDGSLVVGTTPDVELDRPINKGLQNIASVLQGLASKYGTSVADMLVFAANAATVLCPLGPVVTTFIGRTDSTTSAPDGKLPDVNDAPGDIVSLFASKGLSTTDLAALLGAHSTATQFFVDTAQTNASLDSTPGVWDVNFYGETFNYATRGQKPSNVFVLASDQKLATFSSTGQAFRSFVNNQRGWDRSYQTAMAKMVLFGNDRTKMVDCTSALN